MPKYLVLYRAQVPATEQMANATPEETQAGMEAWMTWASKAGDAIIDLGTPLAPATVVGDASGASGASIGGYSVLQADSVDALQAVLDGHPHLNMDGAAIEAHELLPIPGS